MKVFLSILLYLICSDCRIVDGPIEQTPYTILGSGQTDNSYKNYNPIVIKDLNDYTNFYLNYYGEYPGYVDCDFTKSMIVVFFVPANSNDIKIDGIYETTDRISIHMYHPPVLSRYQPYYPTTYQIIEPNTYLMAISLKRSDKIIQVYN